MELMRVISNMVLTFFKLTGFIKVLRKIKHSKFEKTLLLFFVNLINNKFCIFFLNTNFLHLLKKKKHFL